MKSPTVFVSSTCSDLADVRAQLSSFLEEYGFDPILSEANDVFYSPDLSAMESCIESARQCDLFLLIVGARYGSIYDRVTGRSIVRAEFEAAKSAGIPIFTFVHRAILDGLAFYQANKTLVPRGLIVPGILNQDDAPRIFDFLESIMQREKNNAVFAFEYFSDIKEALVKQFAAFLMQLRSERGSSRAPEVLASATYDAEYELNEVAIELDVAKGIYKLEFHKILRNLSRRPVSQVLFHFLTNVYPQDPEKSYRHYLANPIFWNDLNVSTWDAGSPLVTKLVNDHGSRKDFLIVFRHGGVDTPIHKGDAREFWYRYEVPFTQWGPYIDRPITFPTKRCAVSLTAPHNLGINVGGFQISPFRPKMHLGDRIAIDSTGDRVKFSWSSDRLSIGDTYQINWTDFLSRGYGVTDIVTTTQSYVQQ